MLIVAQTGTETNLCEDGWEMEWKFYGDGSETGWGRVGTDIISVGTGEDDGCNLCPCAGLYWKL